MQDYVRVLRIIEYIGPRDWVEKTVANSIHGTKVLDDHGKKRIHGTTLGTSPEILEGDDLPEGPCYKR